MLGMGCDLVHINKMQYPCTEGYFQLPSVSYEEEDMASGIFLPCD